MRTGHAIAVALLQRTGQALADIRGMLSNEASVYRDGAWSTIPASGLVPGDVVRLMPGDKVPADLRLIDIKNLRIQEAVLTGEAEAVEKTIAPAVAEAALGDRTDMVYSGTLVSYGQATGVVVADPALERREAARARIAQASPQRGDVQRLRRQ